MPTPFEAEINSLLRETGDLPQVAAELVRRWQMNLLNEREQIDCAQFLVASGLYPTLLEQARRLHKNGGTLPWAQLAEVLGRSKIPLEARETAALIEGAEAQESLEALLRSHQLDAWDRVFIERRAQVRGQKLLEVEERKKSLKDKIDFMRNNRMFEQERKALDELQALFPDEPELATAKDSFEERWAREVLASSSTLTDPTQDLIWKTERLTPEQVSAKSLIVDRAKQLAAKDPRLAYDLAICLHFMDFNAEAVEVLGDHQSSPAADWLRLELMIRARQYVTALNETLRLEIAYAGDPEAAFASVYARARALWGLGQNAIATDLLRSLVRIRPNYKSAQSLLLDWTGGDV